MNFSDKKIGFTSAMKIGFVFDEDSESRNYPNHVYTEFKATDDAITLAEQNCDTKIMLVEMDGELVVVSVEEAKANSLSEVTLKVVNKNTENAQWVKA